MNPGIILGAGRVTMFFPAHRLAWKAQVMVMGFFNLLHLRMEAMQGIITRVDRNILDMDRTTATKTEALQTERHS